VPGRVEELVRLCDGIGEVIFLENAEAIGKLRGRLREVIMGNGEGLDFEGSERGKGGEGGKGSSPKKMDSPISKFFGRKNTAGALGNGNGNGGSARNIPGFVAGENEIVDQKQDPGWENDGEVMKRVYLGKETGDEGCSRDLYGKLSDKAKQKTAGMYQSTTNFRPVIFLFFNRPHFPGGY
jgi:hypothetical protein